MSSLIGGEGGGGGGGIWSLIERGRQVWNGRRIIAACVERMGMIV